MLKKLQNSVADDSGEVRMIKQKCDQKIKQMKSAFKVMQKETLHMMTVRNKKLIVDSTEHILQMFRDETFSQLKQV